MTYQPDQLGTFRTTGILNAVQRSSDLLAGVESRAQQTTPYLKNLLALSAALQDKYTPQALSTPAAARFLLVSDIHGANQYALMRTIVQQEHIDDLACTDCAYGRHVQVARIAAEALFKAELDGGHEAGDSHIVAYAKQLRQVHEHTLGSKPTCERETD